MRLEHIKDKELERNLRVLRLCAKAKMIELYAKKDTFEQRLEKAKKKGDEYSINIAQQQLEDIKPTIFQLAKLDNIVSTTNNKDKIDDELGNIKSILINKSSPNLFKKFSKEMRTENPNTLVIKYKNKLKAIAKKYGIDKKEEFYDYLLKAFTLKDVEIGLKKEIPSKFKGNIKKLLTAGVLASCLGLAIGKSGTDEPIFDPQNPIEITSTPTPTEAPTPNVSTPMPTTPITATSTPTPTVTPTETSFVPPLSETEPNMKSYEDCMKDFYKKFGEIYKHKTGNTIDLSDYKQSNLRRKDTNVLTVKYNGKTYRFSTAGKYESNLDKLLEALKANLNKENGDIIIEYPQSTIYFIVDNNGSPIAIIDAEGSVRSGSIMQSSDEFDPEYVSKGREYMMQNGLDPTNKSDAELVGFYLLHRPEYPSTEMSQTLMELKQLAEIVKGKPYWKTPKEAGFYYDQTYNGKSYPINIPAIEYYNQTSRDFAEQYNKYNNAFISAQVSDNSTYENDYDNGYDGYEYGEY